MMIMMTMIIALYFLSLLILPQLPWWFIAVLTTIIGFNSKGIFQSIIAGFACGALAWGSILIYNYYNGAELLIGRVSGIISMDGLLGAFMATVLVGGITGFLGSLSAFTFKLAFKDQLIKE